MTVFLAASPPALSFRSAGREEVGIWAPESRVAVIADVALLELVGGSERPRSVSMGAVLGVPLIHAASGATTANVAAFADPGLSPGEFSPVVWCDPVPGAVFTTFSKAVPASDLVDGLEVRALLGRTPADDDGTVISGPPAVAYPDAAHVTPVFSIEVPTSMANKSRWGAPVVLRADPTVLVGFVLRPKNTTLNQFFCYPAFRF